MKTTTGIFLAAAVLLGAASVNAAETAQEVLQKVRKKYDSVRDAEITFSQDVKFALARIDQKSSGILYLKKEDKYRVEFGDRTIVTDGTTVWSYSVANNQVLIDNFKKDENALSPEKLLAGAPSDLAPTLLGRERLGSTATTVLKLVPADELSFIRSLKLWVGDEDSLVHKAEVTDVNGKMTTYSVSEVKTNLGLPDSRFVYHIPEGAEVVDLR